MHLRRDFGAVSPSLERRTDRFEMLERAEAFQQGQTAMGTAREIVGENAY